jgi:Ca2+-binding RTX toxin-like protein
MANIVGTIGADTLVGSAEADTLSGGDGADWLQGGAGDDYLIGGLGDDDLDGGLGADTLAGGAGVDHYRVDHVGDRVLESAGQGYDWVFTALQKYVLPTEVEGLRGLSSAGQHLVGNAQSNSLYGGAGADTLDSGVLGDDRLFGGDGRDRLILNRPQADITSSTLDGGAGDDVLVYSGNFLAVQGGARLVTLIGGDGSDTFLLDKTHPGFMTLGAEVTINAGSGDDYITSTEPTTLFGNAYAARISLGAGRDIIELRLSQLGSQITVTDFTPGEGGDRLHFNDALRSVSGWDGTGNPFQLGLVALVQDGANALLQLGGRTAVTFLGVSAGSMTADNLSGYAPLGGALPGRTLVGSEGEDRLFGFGGADVLEGGGGDDVLRGGGGHDLLRGGLGADDLNGEQGSDTLDGGAGADVLYDGAGGDDLLLGGDGADQLMVDRAKSHGRPNPGPNSSSTLNGGAGDDVITVRAMDFSASVSPHDFTLLGGDGADQITIDSGGRRVIDAGAGDDRVWVGGAGLSTRVTLGAGRDELVLGNYFDSLTVTDFTPGADGDRLTLDPWFSAFAYNRRSGDSPFLQHARLVQDGSSTRLEVDRDGAGGGYSWKTVVVFENTTATSFTAPNFGGHAPVIGSLEVRGTIGNDPWLEGSGQAERILGYAGDDVLVGWGGNDTLEGGLGWDQAHFGGTFAGATFQRQADGSVVVTSSDGVDRLLDIESVWFSGDATWRTIAELVGGYGTAGNDAWVEGTAGDDRLFGLAGDDHLAGYAGNDTLVGGAGWDQAQFGAAFAGARFERQRDGSVQVTSSDGVDRLVDVESVWFGGDGTWRTLQELVGDHGTEGDDAWIEGTARSDRLFGLGGNDTFMGRAGDDTLDGGAGYDQANYEGRRADFRFERLADGSVRVTDATGAEGSDLLVGVEAVYFHADSTWLQLDWVV